MQGENLKPEQLLAEALMEESSADEIHRWACHRLALGDTSQVIESMVACDPCSPDARQTLVGFLRQIVATEVPAFSDIGTEVQCVARRILAERLQMFLDGKIRPAELCRTVNRFDAQFLEATPAATWLGDLYNGCDWIDGTSYDPSPGEVPYLVEEARRVLASLTSSPISTEDCEPQ
ncbi:hypothetical protein AB1L30_14160 [Bremerella sp. JC817]|uniref:hypothetical protein n=1 Tax=Bremerella sp. JC817 TaxID=3231756 RepID=UPI003459D22E